MGRVVLVTGISRDIGRRFARAAASDPAIDRVIGVDVVPPHGDIGDVSFVRADIRSPVIAKVLAKEDVDTVVHMSVIATPGSTGGRHTMKELNVMGTMQLLAACQKSPTVKNLVVKSTTTMYGASSRDPAMFTEEMGPKRLPSTGYAKDVYEVEGYVRGFARRRPDVDVTTIRAANVIGPHVVSPITSYFRLPVIPRVLGFDPRMQFLHEDDLLDVLRHAAVSDVAGTFNVAGDGMLMLSQAIRRLNKPIRVVARLRRRPTRLRAPAGPRRRLLARAARLPDLWSWGGHDADARRHSVSSRATPPRVPSPTSVSPSGSRCAATCSLLLRRVRPVSDAKSSDAQIIPIGTNGRPGRGTGRERPSSAARSLAGTPRTAARKAAPAVPKPAARKAADPWPSRAAAEARRAGCDSSRRHDRGTPPACRRADRRLALRLPGRGASRSSATSGSGASPR